jgi:hypothetical protein
LVLPGAGSQHAQFDPSVWTFRPANAGTYTVAGMEPLMAAAHADVFTLIDRSASVTAARVRFGQRHKALEVDLVRTIHGFDALLVLTGSTASANL